MQGKDQKWISEHSVCGWSVGAYCYVFKFKTRLSSGAIALDKIVSR